MAAKLRADPVLKPAINCRPSYRQGPVEQRIVNVKRFPKEHALSPLVRHNWMEGSWALSEHLVMITFFCLVRAYHEQ